MARVRFHVLASGSSGNACVLDVGGVCVLVDFGLPARVIHQHLMRRGMSWNRLDAAVLTHTHTDHWQPSTLTQLVKHRVPLFCHVGHTAILERDGAAFTALAAAGLVRYYEPGRRTSLTGGCEFVPIALSHDSEPTCGFRFESKRDKSWAIGYAADLGCWTAELARHFADVSLLAVEFNHDIPMQLASRRHPVLIRRVLGDAGHLSNEQGAALLAEVIAQSEPGRLEYLVQLHLSRECNFPALARSAAQAVLDRLGIEVAIHTAVQGKAGPTLRLSKREPDFIQPLLAF